ncbi:tripartite-type tricarboxylate transporter receptor subunit TctC [Spinactinospora alkalitolerans]|uniref:Tripartite-type tricarboxylate transporter receptor subunit TctC n=1 Tax=Spinactinospora alkalitolerans TaxID=687207 RepID=A0A852U5T6_9ACTN|nr:hypothetical protein [Spinactinospora alkalitolerans]NYE50233.1 tripartite-type tricarboxylate transporter receptor subunit TctC [Spinactinospora alkalitolerans]
MPGSLTRRRALGALSLPLLTLAGCATPAPHRAAAVATEGDTLPEQVRMVIPYAEGGGTDVWARFLGPNLTGAMDTPCRMLPENLPGGESIIGSNRYAREAANDGSSVLVASGTTYFQYLLGRPEVEFDFSRLRPLVINAGGGVVYGAAHAGIHGIGDLFSEGADLRYGGISPTGLDLSVLLAFDVLGLDVRSVFGLEGRGPARLALERGELNLDYQTTSAYFTQVEPLIADGRATPLMSFGRLAPSGEVVGDPALPDLPSVRDVYEDVHGDAPSGLAWDAYRTFLAAGFSYQKGIWVAEDTPDSVVAPFFNAVRRLENNEEFLSEGDKVLGGYPVFAGDEAEEEIRSALTVSAEVRDYVFDLLATEHGTVVSGA